MIKRYLHIIFTLLLISLCKFSYGQTYPVSANLQVKAPYSIYLEDYASPALDAMQLNLLLRDLNQPFYDVKLHFTIESTGFAIESSRSIPIAPVAMEGGVPLTLTTADLVPYLDINQLNFSGLSKSEFIKTGRLPEGYYRFCFTVVDSNRPNVRLSAPACATVWIVQNDPPRINLPFCGSEVTLTEPQSIIFQWTPMHTASPNAQTIEYEFTLVEVRPEGRNPNDAINSTTPLYQEVTTHSNLFYGPSKPALIPGQQYVFRIRATDIHRNDLYKNNGYSEACTFFFGQDIQLQPPLNFTGEAESERRVRFEWDEIPEATGYEVSYRKSDNPDYEWFTASTSDINAVINDLEPQTAYEAQVASRLDSYKSEPSHIINFTTPAAPVFTCGETNTGADPLDSTPLPSAIRGSIFTVGKFEMEVLQIEGGDGRFTGYGSVRVPYLSARLNCKFENILVNINHEVIEGEVVALTRGVEGFMEQWNADTDSTGISMEEGFEGVETVVEGLIAEVITSTADSTITIILEDGSEEVYILGATEDNPTGENKFTDEEGEVWVVDGAGNVKHLENPGQQPTTAPDQFYTLTFQPEENQRYGFDSYDIENQVLAGIYPTVEIHESPYQVNWKSVETGRKDFVMATAVGQEAFPEGIRFKISDGATNTYKITGLKNIKQVEVSGIASNEELELLGYVIKKDTFGNEAEEIVGQLNVASFDKIVEKLVVVPVNNATIPNAGQLQTEINAIYASAVMEWHVEVGETFHINEKHLEGWDDGASGMLASFPAAMRKFNKKFENAAELDNDKYYIFLIDGDHSQRSGFMPFKRQFGYVFLDNTSNIAATIAHELGHGAFRLKHTFSEYPTLKKGSTDNLMDYTTKGNRLYKHQWDNIHDPDNMVSWFVDDAEGEYTWSPVDELHALLFNHIYDKNNIDNLEYLTEVEWAIASGNDDFIELRYSSDEVEDWSESDKKWIDQWKIRTLDSDEVFHDIIKSIIDTEKGEKISKVVLRPKHIYVGNYIVEGKQYPVAIYGNGDKTVMENIFTKILVTDPSELEDESTPDKKIYCDETFTKYLIIAFYEDGKSDPSMIIQVEKFLGDNSKEKWLKYLGILEDKVADNTTKNDDFKITLYEGDIEKEEGSFLYITPEPNMPDIRIKINGKTSKYDVKLKIEDIVYKVYEEEWMLVREDISNFPISGWMEIENNVLWDVDFGNSYRGGKVYIIARNNNVEDTLVFHIRGQNPGIESIRTYQATIPNGGGWYFPRMLRQESSFRQFNNGTPGPNNGAAVEEGSRTIDNGGRPNWGPPYGWGLKQLDNLGPSYGMLSTFNERNGPSPNELWNWRENQRKGVEFFNGDKLGAAQIEWNQAIQDLSNWEKINNDLIQDNYPMEIVESLDANEVGLVIEDEMVIGTITYSSHHRNLPIGNESILIADALKRYNGGSYYSLIIPNPQESSVLNPNNDVQLPIWLIDKTQPRGSDKHGNLIQGDYVEEISVTTGW